MKRRYVWLLFLSGLIALSAVWFARSGLKHYTVIQIEKAKQEGVYASPEEGMRALAESYYSNIDRIEIDSAGTNSFDGRAPHVWFVSARVYASARADGKSIGAGDYDYPGSYFLHVDNGWVHVPEGVFPELVGAGMRQFELYGCEREVGNCS